MQVNLSEIRFQPHELRDIGSNVIIFVPIVKFCAHSNIRAIASTNVTNYATSITHRIYCHDVYSTDMHQNEMRKRNSNSSLMETQ